MRPAIHGQLPRTFRRGFTMLELLGVISVILILLGLVFVGLNYVAANMRDRAAGAILGNGKSMVTEYEVSVKTKPTSMSLWGYSGKTPTVLTKQNPWEMQILSPGSMSAAAEQVGGITERTSSPAVLNTGIVMSLLVRAPNNRK